MEGDREVVREGEEKKKGGWFSRKKNTTQKTAYVQRPPSSLNMPRKSSSTTISPDTDDLPERLPHPAQSAGGTPEESPSRDSLSIPKHAGFDFKAIQEMLEKEGGRQKDELEGMAPEIRAAVVPPPPVPPPASRTTSAPQLDSQPDIPPPSLPSSSRIAPPAFEPPTADLSQAFSRSLSFDNANERNLPPTPSQELDIPQPNLDEFLTPTGRFNFQPPPVPYVSFGSPDGAIWGSPPVPDGGFSSLSESKTSFNNGSTTFGAGNSSLSGTGPFTAPTGISFGGNDGSISMGDPWSSSSNSDTKKPSYITNPW